MEAILASLPIYDDCPCCGERAVAEDDLCRACGTPSPPQSEQFAGLAEA